MPREIKKLSFLPVLMTVVVGLITATSLRLHAPDLPVAKETALLKINPNQAPVGSTESVRAKSSSDQKKASESKRQTRTYSSASLSVLRKADMEGRLGGSGTQHSGPSKIITSSSKETRAARNANGYKNNVRPSAVSKDRTQIGPNGTEGIVLSAVRNLELRSSLLRQSN